MKCTNCHDAISYKEKFRLSIKNMYKIECPHCEAELKMTTVSKVIYSVYIIFFALLFVAGYAEFGKTFVWYYAIFWMATSFFLQPLITKYE